jgi:SAM-dependent methyltransferase
MPRMRKWWWLDSVEERPSEADPVAVRRHLEDINASAAVPIEIAEGRIPSGVGVRADDESEATGRVKERFLKEAHHRQYGRPWAMGKYIFEFVVEAGLRPEHRLLDFGCGALRVGNWVIPYLDEGNYFGVEAHLVSLEAAATYEIPLHGLEAKRPRLLWNEDFAFSHFETTFDWIVDFSSSSKVKEGVRREAYSALAEVLAPGGHLLTAPRPDATFEDFEEWGLKLVRGDVVQRCLLLTGHEDSFESRNVWFEFVRE